MVKVSPYPVDHRHEVVTYCLHSSFSEVSKTDLVIFDQLFPFRSCILDRLTYRKALYHRPAKSIRFYILFQIFYRLKSPYFSVWHIMKSRNDSFHPYLPEHLQGYLVLFTEPSPSFFHNVS